MAGLRRRKKAEELERIIADENLNADETKAFVDNAFRDGAIPTTGTAITKILPPVSRFSKNNNHAAKKQTGWCSTSWPRLLRTYSYFGLSCGTGMEYATLAVERQGAGWPPDG
jgi:hypothetical protein